ncbi:MAG: hypothetical protein M3136_02750 [Thermoproteota archaeon]|nr:hypothetical protein [Thermoproteota archaeon]
MNERPALGLIVVAGFIGTVFDISPVFGLAGESFLTIERAIVSIDGDDDELTTELDVEGLLIPTNGTEGAFGYGILTDEGDTILIAHTHTRVLDSEAQRFIEDPIWHNHFVKLGDVEQCGEDQGVVDITWQSPGEVGIDDNIATISGIPTDEFEGWDSITGEPLSMTLGEGVSEVISFKLDPVFDEEDGLESVCVTHIRSAEEEVNIN